MINKNHQNMLWYRTNRAAMTAGEGAGDKGLMICEEEDAKSIYRI